MKKAIDRLKTNKARDPHGFTNELLKEGYMGKNLEEALLTMYDKIKSEHTIPEFITWANITSITKNKRKSRTDMDNQRGIFGLSVFKKLLEYLLFEEY